MPTPAKPFPCDPTGFDMLLSIGGPMNVYKEAAHPWLADENVLLGAATRAGLPVLGVCLEAQLIAKALGAAVTKAPVEEVGWRTVHLPDTLGRGRSLLCRAGAGADRVAMTWRHLHHTLRRLSPKPFAWGRAYGLQFHVEATPEIVRACLLFPALGEQAPMRETFVRQGDKLAAQAERIFGNFVALAAGR